MPAVDLEGLDGRSFVDGGILVTLDRLSVFFPEDQELDVNLDLMARHLLLVAGGMDLAEPRTSWEPVQAIALEDAGYAGSGDLDVVVARQIPNDAHWPQMVGLPQVKYLLDDLWRCAVPGVLRDRPPAA